MYRIGMTLPPGKVETFIAPLNEIELKYAPKSARLQAYRPKKVITESSPRREKYKPKRNRAGK